MGRSRGAGVVRNNGPRGEESRSSVRLVDPELGPCVSNPDAYQVLFENDRVRFLRYIGDTDSRAIFIELKDGGPPAGG